MVLYVFKLLFLIVFYWFLKQNLLAKGKEVGVVTTWAECLERTQGYSGAKFKSFDTREEADVFIFENMFCHRIIIK